MTWMAGFRRKHPLWSTWLDRAIKAEAQPQALRMQTRDFERACRAFVAKQTPVFEST